MRIARSSRWSAGLGLDPELLDERGTRRRVGLERLGLPPGAVEREHQLTARTLAQRVLRHQPLQLADHLGVAPEGEVGVDAVLERREPQLLEARDRALGERLEREVAERRASPQPERLAQPRRPGFRVARGHGVATLGDERLEAVEVDVLRLDLEPIAGALRHDHPGVAERLAELRDVHLDAVRGAPGRRPAPELLDQPIDRHGLVGAQHEDREQRALLRAPDPDDLAVLTGLERSEDAELEHVRRGTVTHAPAGR